MVDDDEIIVPPRRKRPAPTSDSEHEEDGQHISKPPLKRKKVCSLRVLLNRSQKHPLYSQLMFSRHTANGITQPFHQNRRPFRGPPQYRACDRPIGTPPNRQVPAPPIDNDFYHQQLNRSHQHQDSYKSLGPARINVPHPLPPTPAKTSTHPLLLQPPTTDGRPRPPPPGIMSALAMKMI